MMLWSRLGIGISLSLFATSSWGQAAPLQAKQLAGPPQEMASMQAADASAGMQFSRSALLPIEFDAAGNWQGSLPVENDRLQFVLISQKASRAASLVSPSGQTLDSATLAGNRQAVALDASMPGVSGQRYQFNQAASGDWQVQLQGEPGQRGFVLVEGDEAIALGSYQAHHDRKLGQSFVVRSLLEDANSDYSSTRLGTRMDRAILRVTDEAGTETEYLMHDDGRHDDGAANDGVYAAAFRPGSAGVYSAQVIAHGRDGEGNPLIRTTAHLIPVLDSALALAKGTASMQATSDNRLALSLPLAARDPGKHYRVLAEVWGANDVAVAWVGGMVLPEDGRLDIGFDPRWIKRSGARAPFELRNLRIEDPDHFVTLASATRLPLTISKSVARSTASLKHVQSGELDEAMLYGPRPTQLQRLQSDVGINATGRGLMLVHGYCSSAVWPTGDFTGEIVFKDHQKNRSHDAFARLIRSQGDAARNSYGIVAHSQGGAAALHLAAYYWSGLDRASGGRLIQSVGTPYQGTPLAGNLAAIGNVFGVGCGKNTNLTTSGAASWLAGISNSQRAKVNYYTTSEADRSIFNDYCHLATDALLSNPEDGTTEKSRGQLPGAVNRGHKTGWCHTTGMRDTAQYRDSSRNATMDSNAAR
ncbi:choice-of-anchor X domain-containing protein [Pseudoxanthomonas dokdonensis]|uniref:Conditioned medium factor n=1 Tax=Pseudoxanthomonas dokdonensis TaxID=344882 RepID=A0A0R0CGE6_9GAMM|nr:choice-of-anchor X domain-containing protein [Pseudoxanthomonas dokdonensis]KRG68464.1 hypothetical protein ABB29_12620 [Pseudoxanthomonas dokdonensis]